MPVFVHAQGYLGRGSTVNTVKSLSAEASGNLLTNRNHLIFTTVKWDQFGGSTAFV